MREVIKCSVGKKKGLKTSTRVVTDGHHTGSASAVMLWQRNEANKDVGTVEISSLGSFSSLLKVEVVTHREREGWVVSSVLLSAGVEIVTVEKPWRVKMLIRDQGDF